MHATTVAIDLAKDVFELAFADADRQITERARHRRATFATCLDNRPPRDEQADNYVGRTGRLNEWPRLADSMMARALPTAKPNTRKQTLRLAGVEAKASAGRGKSRKLNQPSVSG